MCLCINKRRRFSRTLIEFILSLFLPLLFLLSACFCFPCSIFREDLIGCEREKVFENKGVGEMNSEMYYHGEANIGYSCNKHQYC